MFEESEAINGRDEEEDEYEVEEAAEDGKRVTFSGKLSLALLPLNLRAASS